VEKSLQLIEKGIKEQIALLQVVFTLIQQQRQAIKKRDLPMLHDITNKIEIHLKNIDLLQNEIAKAMQQYRIITGQSPDISWKEVLQNLPGDKGKRLQTLVDELSGLTEEVKMLNSSNQLMVKSCLQWVRQVINMISPGGSGVYGSNGSFNTKLPSTVMLDKTV
jgi:flagellar biosynthesis/type III secretory pathway chaperone